MESFQCISSIVIVTVVMVLFCYGWIGFPLQPGPRFNIKISYQYRKSHCGDKIVLRLSYLHNGISYTGKMTSSYWIRVQINHNTTQCTVDSSQSHLFKLLPRACPWRWDVESFGSFKFDQHFVFVYVVLYLKPDNLVPVIYCIAWFRIGKWLHVFA